MSLHDQIMSMPCRVVDGWDVEGDSTLKILADTYQDGFRDACRAAAKLAQQAEQVAEASPAPAPVVCAWCNPVDPAAPLPPKDQRVSHGICPEHKRQMLAQMRNI